MPSVFKLKQGSIDAAGIVTLLDDELNSLANGAGSAASAAVNQDTGLDLRGHFELQVTFTSNPTDNAPIDIYVMYAIDGTNATDYTSGSTPVANLQSFVGSFNVKATTGAQRVPSPPVILRPFDFKVALVNRCGVAFPASGSVLRFVTEVEQAV